MIKAIGIVKSVSNPLTIEMDVKTIFDVGISPISIPVGDKTISQLNEAIVVAIIEAVRGQGEIVDQNEITFSHFY